MLTEKPWHTAPSWPAWVGVQKLREEFLKKGSPLFSGYHPALESFLTNESVPIVVDGVPGFPGLLGP